MVKLFKNGFVYMTDSRTFEKCDILVKNGVIDRMCPSIDEQADEVIDCTGKYISPGLVDVHTHGRAGYDFNTASSEDIKIMRRAYAKIGTTSVMGTLASAPVDSMMESIDAIKKNAPRENGMATMIGVHLEGRYLSEKRRGAHLTSLLSGLDSDEVSEMIKAIHPMRAHLSAAFELEGGEEFAKTALSLDCTCSLAHSDATYDEAVRAVGFGVTAFTHTFNGMRPVHHREPGTPVASMLCDTAYSEFICDGYHLHPAIVKMASRLKPTGKLVLITDSMEATGCEDGEYLLAGNKVFVKNGLAVNSEGAISGSTLDLFRGVVNYMKFAETTLEQALYCATYVPAEMVHADSFCGALREGRAADMLIIENKEDPTLKTVYIGGEEV